MSYAKGLRDVLIGTSLTAASVEELGDPTDNSGQPPWMRPVRLTVRGGALRSHDAAISPCHWHL